MPGQQEWLQQQQQQRLSAADTPGNSCRNVMVGAAATAALAVTAAASAQVDPMTAAASSLAFGVWSRLGGTLAQ